MLYTLCFTVLSLQGLIATLRRCTRNEDEGKSSKMYLYLNILSTRFPAIFFRISCEFYAPALLSAFINIERVSASSWYFDFVSISVAYIFMFLCVVYPFKIAKDLYSSYSLLEQEDLRKSFPNILDGMKTDKKRYLLFFPIFFSKRFLIVFALIVFRGIRSQLT